MKSCKGGGRDALRWGGTDFGRLCTPTLAYSYYGVPKGLGFRVAYSYEGVPKGLGFRVAYS